MRNEVRHIVVLWLLVGGCFGFRAEHCLGQPIDTIYSKDGKFRVEIRLKKDVDLVTTVTATMMSADGKVLWERDISGDNPAISPGSPPAGIIGEDGSFFIFHRYRYRYQGWALVTPTSETHLTPRDYDRRTYFVSRESSLIHIKQLNGEKAVAVWERDLDSWTAYRTRDGQKIEVTPALAAKLNAEVREEVLTKLDAFRSKARLEEFDASNPSMTRITALLRPANVDELREIDLEFLAIRRDPRDRVVFTRILESETARYEGFFSTLVTQRPYQGEAKSWTHLDFTSSARIAATRLLAVFDGTAKKDYSLSKIEMRSGLSSSSMDYVDTEVRPNLGEVYGTIQVSTPFRNPHGILRVHLVPGENTKDWETRAGTESYSQGVTEFNGTGISDSAALSLPTVLPGKYFLKVIWDRRPPLTDTNYAGPGDYESAFVGPFEVKGGGVISNLTVVCTNRAAGGEEYYRADEVASKLWDDGELRAPGAESFEAFFARADRWILKTNSIAAGRHAWISSIALRKDAPCKAYESALPGGLVVFARDRKGVGKNELSQLEILDEHGCVYEAMGVNDSGALTEFYFPAFPRSDATWRLAGLDSSDEPLFEYTITNLVRIARKEIRAIKVESLPFELSVGPVQLKIANVYKGFEKWEAELDCKIFRDGVVNTNWITLDTRFIDRHGNATSPTNFCREEKVVRVSGKALVRWNLRGVNPFGMDFARIADCYPFEFAVPREMIKKRE